MEDVERHNHVRPEGDRYLKPWRRHCENTSQALSRSNDNSKIIKEWKLWRDMIAYVLKQQYI